MKEAARILHRIMRYVRGLWYEGEAEEGMTSAARHRGAAGHGGVADAAGHHGAAGHGGEVGHHGVAGAARHGGATGAAGHGETTRHHGAAGQHERIPHHSLGGGARQQGEDDVHARYAQLKELYERIAQCVKCPLHQHRTQTVPGSGVLDPDVMVIGEAPGANEDKYGKPFVGRAGKYLDAWLESIGIYRTKNAYIANIIKCRPPQNRDPVPMEIAHCRPYLERQIELIRPKTLLIAGRIAAHHLFDIDASLGQMRTQQHSFHNIPAIVTYHPSAVLRNPAWRRPVWEDLRKLQRLIGEHT